MRCHVFLIIRALAPQPQGASLLSKHAFHHQCGLIQLSAPTAAGRASQECLGRSPQPLVIERSPGEAVPGSEGHLQGDGGWWSIGGSGFQQSTAWEDPKGLCFLVWFLLSYIKRKGGHPGSLHCLGRHHMTPGLPCFSGVISGPASTTGRARQPRFYLALGTGHLYRNDR